MRRRSAIATCVGTVMGLSGCLSRLSPGSRGENGSDDTDDSSPDAESADEPSSGNETGDSNGDSDEGGIENVNSPRDAIEGFYQALYSEDMSADDANEFIHSDSGVTRYTEDTAERLSEFDHELRDFESHESYEDTDDVAVYDFVLVLHDEERGERDRSVTVEVRIEEIEQDDGDPVREWRLYDNDS